MKLKTAVWLLTHTNKIIFWTGYIMGYVTGIITAIVLYVWLL